jgi:hypothetical protein
MESLKPDCGRALQRKSGRLTPFDPEQSILSSPLCRRNITKYGQFSVFRGKKRDSFSAVVVIALRSPDGVAETGLYMCPPEKNARKLARGVRRDTFSSAV